MSPTAPLKPCRFPGCPALTARRFCPEHQAAEYRRQDSVRGSAASRGYGAGHRRWRPLVLARDPLCVFCLTRGLSTPATVADHIVPLSKGGTWELSNGQGLCIPHHNAKTMRERYERNVR